MDRTVIGLLVLAGCGRIGFGAAAAELDAVGDGRVDDTRAGDADVCAVVSSGLLGAWSMNATEVVGTTVEDRSGHGRNGAIVGDPGPGLVAGRIGEALDFSGTTLSYVALPSVPLDGTMGRFTSVSLWFWHDDPGVDEAIVCLPTGPVAGPPRYSLWLTDRITTPSLCINTGSGDCWGTTSQGLIGRWVHVVVVYANGMTNGGQLYVDGVAVTMGCRFGTCDQVRVAQSPLSFGCSDSFYAWHGRLDEIQVFDRALSPTEVSQRTLAAWPKNVASRRFSAAC